DVADGPGHDPQPCRRAARPTGPRRGGEEAHARVLARDEEEAGPGRGPAPEPGPLVPGRAIRGRGRDHVAVDPGPADRLRRPRVHRFPDVARVGDRREAVHARRDYRQGGAGRAGGDGRDSQGRLAGEPVHPVGRGGRRRRPGPDLAGGRVAVNWQHLKAFLWLRWRLRVNQFRKAGALNAVLLIFALVVIGTAAVGLFFTGFFVGLFAMPHASPVARLLVWDGVVVVFLFSWMIGLMADLQRSEGLAIDKFLHLPASPAGVFLVNYLSSLFSLTLIAFVPGMIGLVLGETLSEGPAVLLGLPVVASFLLMVTALTYQFQGWLASLMSNPRRRRTVIVLVTAAVILLAQLPNLINLVRPWDVFTDETKQY